MTNRLIPTLVVSGVILMLMFRGVQTAASQAPSETNSSVVGAVDGVVQGGAQAVSTGLPLGALVGGFALILGGALVVSR